MGDLKYKDNNLDSLKQVKRFDKHGNLIETFIAERLTEEEQHGIRRTYGEKECRVCGDLFTLKKKNQFTCDSCIAKRPVAGLSMRKVPLKSEKLTGGHPRVDIEIQERIQIPTSK